MEIKSIKNQQKEAFIKNLEKGLMATEGVYVDNWFNRKKGRVGMTYAQAQAMEDKENLEKKEKTPGSNRHTIKYGAIGTSTINAAEKAGFSDDNILKEKKIGDNGYQITLSGDVSIEKLHPIIETLQKEYGKNGIEFDKDIDNNGNTIFTVERKVKKTLMHKVDEKIDKASKIFNKIKEELSDSMQYVDKMYKLKYNEKDSSLIKFSKAIAHFNPLYGAATAGVMSAKGLVAAYNEAKNSLQKLKENSKDSKLKKVINKINDSIEKIKNQKEINKRKLERRKYWKESLENRRKGPIGDKDIKSNPFE